MGINWDCDFCALPVEDKKNPLDEIEYKVYKKHTIFLTAAELMLGLTLKLVGLDNLLVAVVYSFAVWDLMLIAGKIKISLIR